MEAKIVIRPCFHFGVARGSGGLACRLSLPNKCACCAPFSGSAGRARAYLCLRTKDHVAQLPNAEEGGLLLPRRLVDYCGKGAKTLSPKAP